MATQQKQQPQLDPTFVALAIQSELARMFAPSGHLDITALDTLWKLGGVQPAPLTREALRLFHCKNWNTQLPQVREYAALEVVKTFGWEPNRARLLTQP